MDEDALLQQYTGERVPEAIFDNPFRKGTVSVEVKRLPSLAHLDGSYNGFGFIWQNTVAGAIDKAHGNIVRANNVTDHHVVFCVPSSIARRIGKHVQKAAWLHVKSAQCACTARRVHIHILPTPAKILNTTH